MALPSRASADDWSSAIAEVAVSQMNGEIKIFDPQSLTRTPFDPVTDLGGESVMALVAGPLAARIQQIRTPTEFLSPGGTSTKIYFRFQVQMTADLPRIYKGLEIRVTDGGRDPSLVGPAYTIVAAPNSSHAAVRTITATTDMQALPS